jgi:hypothetical protein
LFLPASRAPTPETAHNSSSLDSPLAMFLHNAFSFHVPMAIAAFPSTIHAGYTELFFWEALVLTCPEIPAWIRQLQYLEVWLRTL